MKIPSKLPGRDQLVFNKNKTFFQIYSDQYSQQVTERPIRIHIRVTTESPVRTNQHFAQDRKAEVRKNVRKNVRLEDRKNQYLPRDRKDVRKEDRIRTNLNQDRKPTLAPFLSEAR